MRFSPLERSTFLGRGAVTVLVAVATSVVVSAASVDRPNVLLVVADDLGYGDIGCFGHPEIATPHLDRLAATGLRLTNAYSAAPLCSPARAGIMTGRTPSRAGIYSWIPMMSPMHLRAGEVTIATLLRKSGYATALIGKWHLNGLFNLPGQPQPHDHGFEYWFSVQNNALPDHHNPYNFVRNGIPMGPIEGYSGPIVAQEAVKWLTEVRDASKPFFLYVAFNEPHEPIATDPRYAAPYKKTHSDDPSRVAYYGNVTQMDAALGQILGALAKQGLADDTLVWFTSDNGPARTHWHNAGSSGGLREYKLHLYEGGIRVPGIIRWPGRIAAGSTSSEPISGVDVLPTLCEVAGIVPPADRVLDGTSILPVLEGRALPRRTPLYWQYVAAPSNPQVALRKGRWKLLAALEGLRTRTPEGDSEENMRLIKQARFTDLELYDLESDPAETRNQAAAQPATLAQLLAALEKLHGAVRADAPSWPAWVFPEYESKRIRRPDYAAKPRISGR